MDAINRQMKKSTTDLTFPAIVRTSFTLQEIIKKSEQLTKLNQIVLQKMDTNLKSHCRVANLRDGILILAAASPAYGHLLRFKQVDLLSALRAEPEWCGLKSIQTRVDPHFHPGFLLVEKPLNPWLHKAPLSKESASLIQKTASDVESPRLRKALLKLATHSTVHALF